MFIELHAKNFLPIQTTFVKDVESCSYKIRIKTLNRYVKVMMNNLKYWHQLDDGTRNLLLNVSISKVQAFFNCKYYSMTIVTCIEEKQYNKIDE